MSFFVGMALTGPLIDTLHQGASLGLVVGGLFYLHSAFDSGMHRGCSKYTFKFIGISMLRLPDV